MKNSCKKIKGLRSFWLFGELFSILLNFALHLEDYGQYSVWDALW